MPGLLCNIVDASRRRRSAIGSHETSIPVHEDGHEGGTDEERPAASPAIDEYQGEDRHENVDDILNRRGDEAGVASETCHAEDINDI